MMAESRMEFKVECVQEKLEGVVQWLNEAATNGTPAHEVERSLFRQVLELGRQLFGAFLQAVGSGDLGPEVELSEGHVVKRLENEHRRRLLTVFGEFTLSRWVYGIDERQKIELVPTDQRLQLPAGELSYLLQEWDQLLGVEQAFGVVHEMLHTILRIKQSVDTLEHGSREMAEAAAAFREQQPVPDPQTERSCWSSPRTTRASRWSVRRTRRGPALMPRKARRRTRRRWRASAAYTRWIGTCARQTSSRPRCFAIRIVRKPCHRRLSTNDTGRN